MCYQLKAERNVTLITSHNIIRLINPNKTIRSNKNRPLGGPLFIRFLARMCQQNWQDERAFSVFLE